VAGTINQHWSVTAAAVAAAATAAAVSDLQFKPNGYSKYAIHSHKYYLSHLIVANETSSTSHIHHTELVRKKRDPSHQPVSQKDCTNATFSARFFPARDQHILNSKGGLYPSSSHLNLY
jgi:hypothetical protein